MNEYEQKNLCNSCNSWQIRNFVFSEASLCTLRLTIKTANFTNEHEQKN